MIPMISSLALSTPHWSCAVDLGCLTITHYCGTTKVGDIGKPVHTACDLQISCHGRWVLVNRSGWLSIRKLVHLEHKTAVAVFK